MTDVSVVITSYNTRGLLLDCLHSVFSDLRSGAQSGEVIVVDDGSADGTAAVVRSAFPEVRVLRNDTPQGYARANNRGILAASGEAILLLNSDTVIHQGAIPSMIRQLAADPQIGGVGPILRNRDGSIQRSCFRFPMRELIGNSLSLPRLGLWDDYRRWDHHRDRFVDCISSAALMVRSKLFREVGLLDEEFWVYGVDIDYAMRMRAAGYRLLSLQGATVTHYGGASWQGMTDRAFADSIRSVERLYKKHYGRAGYLFFRIVLLGNSLIRLAFWKAVCALGARGYAGKVDHFKRHLHWALRT